MKLKQFTGLPSYAGTYMKLLAKAPVDSSTAQWPAVSTIEYPGLPPSSTTAPEQT